ncbi:MAG: hypothetical protein ACLFUW_00210 [Bacteroidales bacterium]
MSYPIYGTLVEENEIDEKKNFPVFGTPIDESATFETQVGPIPREGGRKGILEEASSDPRHIIRSLSRAGESIVGLPGDLASMVQGLGIKGLEKVSGKDLSKVKKATDVFLPPTSKEIYDLSYKIFGEKINPQNEKEKFADDVISDLAVLALPVKGKIPFARSIGTALAGNITKETAKALGVGETGQELTKLGTFFLSGLIGRGGVKKYWNENYKKANEAIPDGAKVSSFGMERKIDKVERTLKKGIETPSKKFVLSPLKEIRSKIKTGEVKVDELVQMKKDLNEIRGKLYSELPGKQSIKYAQGKINDVAEIIDSTLENYGKTNPSFLKPYKNANEAYAGFQQSRKVGNWMKRNLPFKNMSKGSFLILEAIFKPAALGATVPAYGVLKSGELLARIGKNPSLRNHYLNIIKAAANENKGGLLRHLSKLEKGLEKDYPEFED